MLKTSFIPGKEWLDTDGNLIQAHGGGMLYYEDTYYWFGENKDGPTLLDAKPESWERVDVIGISCYSSKDLYNWKNEGIVLPAVQDDQDHDLHPSKVLERPKVIWNPKTKKFVLYAHVDTADYSKASLGIAISDSPVGPYKYLGSFYPNGNDSRDMTVFCDGKSAYLVFSSEWNKTMHIIQLDDSYQKPTTKETKIFVNQSREAPAVFKVDNKYCLLTSGCTGWEPNQALLAETTSMLENWKVIGNPCVGTDADLTFHAQSAFVFPVYGKPKAFIAMFDRWNKKELRESRYMWLPVIINDDGKIEIQWHAEWDLSVFDKTFEKNHGE